MVKSCLTNKPVAGVAEHLVVVLSDGAGVKQLATGGATEAELVVDVAQTFPLLGKVHVLLASWTNAGHCSALFSCSVLIWKSKNCEKM